MSATRVSVPDIGDFTNIPVIDILVKPGDAIKREDPLVTLESEKATMDVPASADGVVGELLVKVGDRVSQGTPLLTVTVADSVASLPTAAAPPERDTPGAGKNDANAPALLEPAGATRSTNVSSNGTSSHARDAAAGGDDALAIGSETTAPIHASPGVRRFARELGVDLAGVRGSGPNARITRDDVQDFIKHALRAPAPHPNGSAFTLAPAAKVDFSRFGPVKREPLTRIQRIAGPALQRNAVTIPHVTSCDDADITALEAFRNQINAEQSAVKITLLAFLMKASVAALKRFPTFNSSLDGEEIVVKDFFNIGFAADTPDGLVVPVIKEVDRKGILEIAAQTSELASKAREGKLAATDMQGGTFTLSSLGGIGGTYFTPIINAPEVAILGVCRAAMRPVWNGAAFEPALMLPLSLSWDHRVVDGAAAARFLVYLISVLRDLRRTML